MIGPILSGRDVVGETRPGRIQNQRPNQIQQPSEGGKEMGEEDVWGEEEAVVTTKMGASQWGEIFWTPGLTCERRAGGGTEARCIDTVQQIMQIPLLLFLSNLQGTAA